jgi:xanthine dehydrogenase iron-sulfur cluster and FAD-binding subunit A
MWHGVRTRTVDRSVPGSFCNVGLRSATDEVVVTRQVGHAVRMFSTASNYCIDANQNFSRLLLDRKFETSAELYKPHPKLDYLAGSLILVLNLTSVQQQQKNIVLRVIRFETLSENDRTISFSLPDIRIQHSIIFDGYAI